MKPMEFKLEYPADYKQTGKVMVHGVCIVTKKPHTILVNREELQNWLDAKGPQQYIQDLMPTATADEREFLISSTSPDGWKQLFPSGEADHFPPAVEARLEEQEQRELGQVMPPIPTAESSDEEIRLSLEPLEDEYLHSIAKFNGGNELCRREAVAAQAILDKRHPIGELKEGSHRFLFDD